MKPIPASLLALFLPIATAQEPAAQQNQKVARHSSQAGEPFAIAVLPDTQFYCDTRLKLSAKWGNGDLRRYFFAQTEWVRDNQERLNIVFLVHEGDLVQADAPEEWAIAKKAMSLLDGKVPYSMCLGNHDMGFEKADNKYGGNIGVNRTTHFNTYFPREKFAQRREFGGTFDPDRHDNSWYHFEAAGMRFLIVSLECKPRDEVLKWANQVVAKHPDHRVIVLTHAYMKADKSRNTGGMKAKGNTGEQTWQKFVKKHKNIFMVLCGHHTGEALRTDAGDHGNLVHQILCDYQGLHNGGESWLRYMVFEPAENEIRIHTYNPVLDKFKNGPSSRFDLDYPMALPPVTAPVGPAITKVDIRPSKIEFRRWNIPVELTSLEDAKKHFEGDALDQLKAKVDFGNQIVLVFAWRGSGQDKLDYVVMESFPEQIAFSCRPGRTRDLRPHVHVFALRSNVKWRAGGK